MGRIFGYLRTSELYSPRCGYIVSYDAEGRGIGCANPRCEEAGQRRLCLQHWQELVATREARRREKSAKAHKP